MNWTLLANSLLVSSLAAVFAAVLGCSATVSLAGLPRPARRMLLLAAVMTAALPPFLVTNCWLHFLGLAGVWRGWLPLNILTPGGTVWILSLLTWPIPLLAVWGAWQRLEPSQLESDPAVTGWPLLRGLLLPLARTALAQAAVLTFVLALNNFAVPAILQVKVFPAEMWVRFNTNFDTAGALRLSWPLVLAPLLLILWLIRGEIPWPRLEGTVPARLFRRQIGAPWFWSCTLLTLVLCLLSLALPVLQLVAVKRTWTELPGALAAGQSAVWSSFWFAAAAATLVLALGLAGTRTRPPRVTRTNRSTLPFHLAPLLDGLLWMPFLIPGVLLGIGLIVVFNHPGTRFFYQSAGIVVLAFVIRYLALGWHAVAQTLRGLDRDLADAAKLEGASPWQRFRLVYWPQASSRLAGAWYLVFLLCLWDVESMILVTPPGGETVALRVFNLLHYGHNAQVNALCLTLLALAVAPLLLWLAASSLRQAWSRAPAIGLLGGCLLLTLGGCSLSPSAEETPLQSKLFCAVRVLGTRGVGIGQFNKPRSLAVDRRDNVYVVDMTGRVQKFSSNGQFVVSWQMPQTDLGRPKGMGRDRDGNVIVVEPHYQRVNHFSPSGRLVAQWGHRGTNDGQLIMPRAIAINSQDEALISEYGVVERIQRFSLVAIEPLLTAPTVPADIRHTGLPEARQGTGVPVVGQPSHRPLEPTAAPQPGGEATAPTAAQPEFLASFGHPGTSQGELNRPEGLCVDAQDRLYVADSCNHRIQIFSPDGKFLRAYGKPGQGLGDLSYPYDIRVDAEGRQYVCEFGNSRIQVFDAHDQPIEIIGGPGADPGRFNDPWSIDLDSAGNLYVADSQNHRVQKLLRSPHPAAVK